MILFTLALYGLPVVLALVTLWVGAKGLRFYWTEVVQGGSAVAQPGPETEGRS